MKKYFNLIYNKLNNNMNIDYDNYDILNNNYLFFPTQVSSDTQIQLNSKIDNFVAIRKAKEMAESDGIDLLVRIHPAEVDRRL